jgi:hypothetical protein
MSKSIMFQFEVVPAKDGNDFAANLDLSKIAKQDRGVANAVFQGIMDHFKATDYDKCGIHHVTVKMANGGWDVSLGHADDFVLQ